MEKKASNKFLGVLLVILTILAMLVLMLGGLFCAVIGILHAVNANLGNALFFIGLFVIALGILSLGLFNKKAIVVGLKKRLNGEEGK